MKRILPLVLFLLCANAGIAQIRKYIYDPAILHAWLQEYTRLVSISNVLGDSLNMAK